MEFQRLMLCIKKVEIHFFEVIWLGLKKLNV